MRFHQFRTNPQHDGRKKIFRYLQCAAQKLQNRWPKHGFLTAAHSRVVGDHLWPRAMSSVRHGDMSWIMWRFPKWGYRFLSSKSSDHDLVLKQPWDLPCLRNPHSLIHQLEDLFAFWDGFCLLLPNRWCWRTIWGSGFTIYVRLKLFRNTEFGIE